MSWVCIPLQQATGALVKYLGEASVANVVNAKAEIHTFRACLCSAPSVCQHEVYQHVGKRKNEKQTLEHKQVTKLGKKGLFMYVLTFQGFTLVGKRALCGIII